MTKTSQAKKAQVISEMKETLTLAIFELQLEKNGKATIDDITQEWIDKTIKGYECKVINDVTIEGKKIKMTKNGITGMFIINSDLKIEEIQGGLEFYYEIVEKVEDKLKILIHVQNEVEGLSRIEFPDKDAIIIEKNKTEEKAIDYEIEYDKEYKIKVKSEDGSEKEITIIEYKVIKPTIKAETEWTNKDVTVEVDFGEINKNVKKQISIDGGITYNTYTGPVKVEKNTIVKARAIGIGVQEESELEIKNIDKLEPQEFTPTVSDLVSATELIISANTVDEDATNEYGKSEISKYKYYVYEGETLITNSEEISNKSWTASGLTVGNTYDIYVEAYDKAGNIKKSEKLTYIKLEVYKWAYYKSERKAVYDYDVTPNYTYTTKYREVYYSGGWNVSKSFDPSTGYFSNNFASETRSIELMNSSGWAFKESAYANTVYVINSKWTFDNQTGYYTFNVTKYTSKLVSQEYNKQGDILGYVTSNDPNAHPENGAQGNKYWYEKVN